MKYFPVFILILLLEISGLKTIAQQSQFHQRESQLSCNLITGMAQDAYGFVWIATENGLNRFDGWKCVSYFHDEKDASSLAGNTVRKLLTDKEGRLWVGTNNGLQYYCPYKDAFHSVQFPESAHPGISDIIQLHTGEIGVVTSGYGAFFINPETLETTYAEWITKLCNSLFMNCIYEDRSHNLWIAYVGNRLACISPESKTARTHILPDAPSPKVYDIEEDTGGRLFISTHEHFLCKDGQHEELQTIGYGNRTSVDVRGMIKCSNGTLLVNSESCGLLYLDTLKMELQSVEKLPGHMSKQAKGKITAFIEDRNGNLWINSNQKGISIIPGTPFQFTFFDFANLNPEGYTSVIYRDKANDVWIGNTDGTLYRTDNEGNIKNSFRVPKPICSMLENSEGTCLLGTRYGGILQFDRTTGKCTSLSLFKDKTVSQMIEGKNKVLYFALPGTGFACHDLKTKESRLITYTTRLKTETQLGNDWIYALLCDSEGLIWIGHATGINCYDPEKKIFLKLPCDSILNERVCYALMEDNDGNIWIGTNNSLYAYDKTTRLTRHYDREDGIPSNIICGLAGDSKGNIWCSTYKGLCRINRKDNRILNYFSGNGLTDTEYTTSVYYQDREGKAYFGGRYGVTCFLPDSVRTPYRLQRPVLTQLYLNNSQTGTKVLSDKHSSSATALMDLSHLYFSSRDNNFSLEFSTLEFHDRTNIRFEYRLRELDSKWSTTDAGENKVTYNYLPPEHYTLEVRACENEVYSPVQRLSIDIAPPWYLSVWALIGYIFLFLALAAGSYYAWYTRQCRKHREEANEEKLRFFINIAHEIRSPITLILSPLTELMKKDYDTETVNTLKTMQRNANRILNLINQLLDIRRIDKGQMKITCRETDLVGFITDIYNMFDYQAGKRHIKFSFIHSADTLPIWIDCNNFDKVLMNLLMNAFKYTPDGGEITILLTSGTDESANTPLKHYAEIAISDSGTGLDDKETEKIFERFYQAKSNNSIGFGIGLNLARMLVELHHGKITAANRTDAQGSCFTVRLPLGNSHLESDERTGTPCPSHRLPEIASDWELKEAKEQNRKSKTRYRILIADDDKEVCEYLQRELENIYKIQTCSNGAEALALALQQRTDLIISDVVMPEMDGFELLKKVKTNANISHIPIILLTSQAEAENRLKGWEVGADGFLAKPFRIEELTLLCANLIATRSHLKGKFGGGRELESKIKPIEVKSNDELLMERLMEVVNRHLTDPKFTVENLAEEVGISRVQLHRKLKEMTGVSTGEFIRNIRLRQAAKLLKEKKINISQIAYTVGFTNPALFSIAFKNLYGCSPKDYGEWDKEDAEESR